MILLLPLERLVPGFVRLNFFDWTGQAISFSARFGLQKIMCYLRRVGSHQRKVWEKSLVL